MPNSEYKITLDVGKIIYIRAKSREKAIEHYCKETGISKEWMREHCTVKNMGLAKERLIWKQKSGLRKERI